MLRAAPLALFLCLLLSAQDRSASEKAKAFGEHTAAEIEREHRLLDDPQLAGFLSRLAVDLSPDAIHVKVIDSKRVQALSLPGGYIFLTRTLLTKPETESELAAILAHQIAHIRAHHSKRLASRSPISVAGFSPITFLPAGRSLCARLGENALWPLGLDSQVRLAEKEADMLGMIYLHQAGLDPEGLVDVFRKLTAKGGLQPRSPLDESFQLQHLELLAGLRDDREPIVTTSEFDNLRARLTAGPPPRKPKPPTLHR